MAHEHGWQPARRDLKMQNGWLQIIGDCLNVMKESESIKKKKQKKKHVQYQCMITNIINMNIDCVIHEMQK